ncbi:hypothetical protein [Burkholderia sp. BCC0405]|uniref:hypothetical protein n=1 Tax=Burkholderia sp. BCC0405 TaxID=2676298 RepID=UPI00158B32CC|nr:hypothetical protein [Burkholderia sp. BCC0405]
MLFMRALAVATSKRAMPSPERQVGDIDAIAVAVRSDRVKHAAAASHSSDLDRFGTIALQATLQATSSPFADRLSIDTQGCTGNACGRLDMGAPENDPDILPAVPSFVRQARHIDANRHAKRRHPAEQGLRHSPNRASFPAFNRHRPAIDRIIFRIPLPPVHSTQPHRA